MDVLLPKTMRAAGIRGYNEEIEVFEVSVREPKEDEVVVKIMVSGVNEDWRTIEGQYLPKDRIPKWPMCCFGWEFSGQVVKVGDKVKTVKENDNVWGVSCDLKGFYKRVFGGGSMAMAEYMTLSSENITTIPQNLTFNESFVVGSLLTAYQTVTRFGKLQRGESAIVIGASGRTGQFVVQFCKSIGVKTACLGSPPSHERLKRLGANFVFDYADENLKKKILELFPNGVDNLVDLYGGKLIRELEDVVKHGGKVISIVEILGYKLQEPGKRVFIAVDSVPIQEDLVEIKKIVESGSVQIEVSKEYSLDEVSQAFSDVKSRKVKGKVSLVISE